MWGTIKHNEVVDLLKEGSIKSKLWNDNVTCKEIIDYSFP